MGQDASNVNSNKKEDGNPTKDLPPKCDHSFFDVWWESRTSFAQMDL
jgi:hypothetical protein